MKKIILIANVCLSFGVCFADNIYKAQTDNAEESFKKGDFQKTIGIYESLIQIEKVKDPCIYYNLSNAYYRSGDIGRAILNIEKALKFSPRDKEIKENAQFLCMQAGRKKEQNIRDVLVKHFSLNEITVVTSVFVILFLILFSLFILKKNSFIKKIVILFVLILIICLPIFVLKSCDEFSVKKGVVLLSSLLRSGPGENNPEIFKIAEGEIVNINTEHKDWLNISVCLKGENVSGWVEAKFVGSINE